jgi:hypothetical protein
MENNKPARKSNIMMTAVVILGVLLLTSLVAMLLFINKSTKLENEKVVLSDNLVMVEGQLADQIQENNINRNEIAFLQDSIASITTSHEKALAAKDSRIFVLRKQGNKRIAELEKELETLKAVEDEYEKLQMRYDKLLAETLRKRDEIRVLNQRLSDLQDTVDMSKRLAVYNISTLTKWDRWLFADRYNVETARRVNEIYVNFEIDGSLFVNHGKRNVYLNLLDPQGNLLYPQGDDFQYTMMQEIYYSGDYIPMEFIISNSEKLRPGTYTFQVYIGGELVRETCVDFN